jgi:hypothetical protein
MSGFQRVLFRANFVFQFRFPPFLDVFLKKGIRCFGRKDVLVLVFAVFSLYQRMRSVRKVFIPFLLE